MKKYLLFLLAFLPMVVFMACSSDDDVINNPIVGTWTVSNEFEDSETTFNSNGTVSEISTSMKSGDKWEYVGSYSINGDKLTINWEKSRKYNAAIKTWSSYSKEKETVVITFKIKDNELIYLGMDGEEQNSPIYHIRK